MRVTFAGMTLPLRPIIVIFAKAPQPGLCKTRLIPLLGARGAARVQNRLLHKVVATAGSLDAEVVIYTDGRLTHPSFLRLRRQGLRLQKQARTDLGQRMRIALAAEQRPGQPCLILGTDCPGLRRHDLIQALATLARTDVVCSPAMDGGYVLIGTRHYQPSLFRRIAWGSPWVFSQTRHAARKSKQRFTPLAPLADLDWPRDYFQARRRGELAGY